MTQEMTEAGPASDEAYNAPNNQPAPMIEPRDAKRSPNKPMSRRSVRSARSEVATNGCASSAVALPLPNMGARDLLGHALDHGPSPLLPQPCRCTVLLVTRFVVDCETLLRIAAGEIEVAAEHQLVAPTLVRSQALSALYESARRGDISD